MYPVGATVMSNLTKYATNRNLVIACISFVVLVIAIFTQVQKENDQRSEILAILQEQATAPQNISVENLTLVLPAPVNSSSSNIEPSATVANLKSVIIQ